MELYKRLGNRVKQKRIELGWTQDNLAEASKLTQSFVGSIERGIKKPSIVSLVKIANALGVNMDYLLRDSVRYDNSQSMERTSSLISDLSEEELNHINDIIYKARQLMKKDEEEDKDKKK